MDYTMKAPQFMVSDTNQLYFNGETVDLEPFHFHTKSVSDRRKVIEFGWISRPNVCQLRRLITSESIKNVIFS